MLKNEIGLRIKQIRLNMNLSKKDFANMLGITGQYLGMIESGKGTLSFDKLQKLCEITNLTSDYILFGKDSSYYSKINTLLSDYSSESIHSGLESLEKFALFIKNLSA